MCDESIDMERRERAWDYVIISNGGGNGGGGQSGAVGRQLCVFGAWSIIIAVLTGALASRRATNCEDVGFGGEDKRVVGSGG